MQLAVDRIESTLISPAYTTDTTYTQQQWVFALFAGSYAVGALGYWLWVGDTDIMGPDECDV